MKPFDYINNINTKKYKITDFSEYNAFLTNRALSYFKDTVMCANLLNEYAFIPYDLQYRVYFESLTKRPRFTKWPKKNDDDVIKLIMEKYNYNRSRAKEVQNFFSDGDIQQLKASMSKGG